MSAERAVLTGVGVLSALGDEPRELHRALVAGKHAREPVSVESFPELAGGEVAALPDFVPERYLGSDTNLRPLDGPGRRLAAAAALALADSGWTVAMRETEPVGLVVGTMFGGMRTIAEFDRRALVAGPQYVLPLDFANTVFNAAAGQTAIRHRLAGPNVTIGGGPLAAVQALGYAADLIRSGHAGAVLAGGVEELSPEALRGFASAGLLSGLGGNGRPGTPIPFDERRDGFALGEGAVLFMIESETGARRRGARPLAEIVGCRSTWAPSETGVEGLADALARAIGALFEECGIAAAEIDAWSASANGGVELDRAEAMGVREALDGSAARVAVCAVKSMLGEALGAAGALQALALTGAMESGLLPGLAGLESPEAGLGISLRSASRPVDLRLGLVTAVGFDGGAEALLLRRWEGEAHEAC